MSKEFKIYHTETQEDYDDLMIKLEVEGYTWASGDKPTSKNYWWEYTGKTVIYLGKWGEGKITRSNLSEAKGNYSTIPIIKHKADKKDKAKGVEQMEKVVVPQFIAEFIEDHHDGKRPCDWDKADLIRDRDNYINISGNLEVKEWVKNESNFLSFIMAIATNNYEVEEEKKYYWRKKKEHMLEFETTVKFAYLNYGCITGDLFFSESDLTRNVKTKFTETEVRELVGEEDFNKLEKVEITDDEC